MNKKQAAEALAELAASPAAGWIGNRFSNGTWLNKCMRCGVEETLGIPTHLRHPVNPAAVPEGFDETLHAWMRAFQIAHEGCVAPDTDTAPPVPSTTPDVDLKRILTCARHGERHWQGHVMCDACGQTYQTPYRAHQGAAPDRCRCGKPLLPPLAERIGDALGLQTGGVVIDAEGRRYQTPEAQDWMARAICYLCYRYFAKHHGGRVPIETGRN